MSERRDGPGGDERPVVPDRSDDERDEGWGERANERDADERRLLEDRPPHHDGRSLG
jgi:hypothetical protein